MGWENVFQVEFDPWCQKVLAKNFPDALRFGDIVEFNKMLENGEITTDTVSQPTGCKCGTACDKEWRTDEDRGEGIRQIYREIGASGVNTTDTINGIYLGHIDIITGGFPCQPFSHAGKRKGTDDSRYLWPAMLETIRRVKPSYVVGENVAGLVSMENGKTLDRILADLEDEGYATEQVIIPACAIGAWHRRDRIWIIAHNANAGIKNLHRRGNTICRCENVPHSRLLGSEIDEQQAAGFVECGEDAAYGDNQGLQIRGKSERIEKKGWENENGSVKQFAGNDGRTLSTERGGFGTTKSLLGGMAYGLPSFMDGYWDREPEGVPRVATGVKDRVNRLKGLGNAIVPQIALQLFKAIAEYKNI